MATDVASSWTRAERGGIRREVCGTPSNAPSRLLPVLTFLWTNQTDLKLQTAIGRFQLILISSRGPTTGVLTRHHTVVGPEASRQQQILTLPASCYLLNNRQPNITTLAEEKAPPPPLPPQASGLRTPAIAERARRFDEISVCSRRLRPRLSAPL